MIGFILKLVFAFAIIALGFGFFRTWQVESSDTQKQFAAASAPKVPLNGFYKGSVNTPIKVTWAGKKFNPNEGTGINVFDDGGGSQREGYPFTFGVGSTGSTTVLYISYDLPANPFWIRPIVDQLVEVSPGHYLGKMTARIVYGYPFSLGFFKLDK